MGSVTSPNIKTLQFQASLIYLFMTLTNGEKKSEIKKLYKNFYFVCKMEI